jgi:hypothetical protein
LRVATPRGRETPGPFSNAGVPRCKNIRIGCATSVWQVLGPGGADDACGESPWNDRGEVITVTWGYEPHSTTLTPTTGGASMEIRPCLAFRDWMPGARPIDRKVRVRRQRRRAWQSTHTATGYSHGLAHAAFLDFSDPSENQDSVGTFATVRHAIAASGLIARSNLMAVCLLVSCRVV